MLDLNSGTLLWLEGRTDIRVYDDYNIKTILQELRDGDRGIYFVAMCIRKERKSIEELAGGGSFTITTD